MNINKLLFFTLFITLLSVPVSAFQLVGTKNPPSVQNQNISDDDDLARHLSAAETYQISGDLNGAGIENRAILAIGLRQLGNIANREGQTKRAVELLSKSLNYKDNVDARINLAISYMNLRVPEDAVPQAQAAISLEPKNVRALQALGNIYFSKGDYAAALPILERAIVLQQDFEIAYTLGKTYLQLRQLERAKLLFEEMQIALKNSAGLNVLIGQAYDETNYPLEAEREFRQALAKDAKVPNAHFYLGYVILQHGGSERLPEAGKEFEQELALNPQNAYANFLAGVVAASNNENQRAVSFLEKSVSLNSTLAPAYLFLGQAQIELSDDANAEKSLRKSIELTGDASTNSYQIRRAHFLLGRLLARTGRKEESEKELTIARNLQGQLVESAREEIRKVLGQVVSTTPRSGTSSSTATGIQQLSAGDAAQLRNAKNQLSEIVAQAFHNLAVIAVQQNQIEESLAAFVAAAEWKPDFPGLNRNWGIVAFRANLFEQAVAPLTRQVKADPSDVLTRRMLGVSYYFTKNFKQAAETLKPLEAKITSDPELAYFYGISLVQLEKNAEAAQIFTNLSAQTPKTAQTSFYAGQGFVFVGDYPKALSEFREAAKLEPQTPKLHYSAGQSLIRMNQLEEAEKEFRLELAVNPGDELSKYHLAYTMLERKVKTDEALNLLREAIVAKYDYADARYQLGKALIEKGDIPEAVNQLEIAAQSEPNKDYIRYQLSIAYRRAARPADAERELKLYSQLKAANRSKTPTGMGTQKNAP